MPNRQRISTSRRSVREKCYSVVSMPKRRIKIAKKFMPYQSHTQTTIYMRFFSFILQHRRAFRLVSVFFQRFA